jgi:N6-L-threonylcarbamoyladenine synthase
MRILAIETSCDETAIAIAEFKGPKARPLIRVLSHVLASQEKIHAKFGGVVPNLARREHQKNLVPLLRRALKKVSRKDLRFTNYDLRKKPRDNILRSKILNLKSILDREPELLARFKKHIIPLAVPRIDAIAVTYGPGLEPALWVGVNFARALAVLWNKPLIPVNHMAGHVYSALLETKQNKSKIKSQKSKLQVKNQNFQRDKNHRLKVIRFPALTLLVSGGHTQLVLMKGHGKYTMLGETRDDAAGEAFDKVARLLGLGGIQGGPAISALAEKHSKDQEVSVKVSLPRPMLYTKDFDFSFSGLKTAVLYKLRELERDHSMQELQGVIAKEFQDAAVEVLVKKTIRAAAEYKAKTVILGGGVAANKKLRHDLGAAIEKELPGAYYLIPEPSMAGDNALMIAIAAFFTGKRVRPEKVKAEANLSLS